MGSSTRVRTLPFRRSNAIAPYRPRSRSWRQACDAGRAQDILDFALVAFDDALSQAILDVPEMLARKRNRPIAIFGLERGGDRRMFIDATKRKSRGLEG